MRQRLTLWELFSLMEQDVRSDRRACCQVRLESGESVVDEIHGLIYLKGPKAIVQGAIDSLFEAYPTTEEIEKLVSRG